MALLVLMGDDRVISRAFPGVGGEVAAGVSGELPVSAWTGGEGVSSATLGSMVDRMCLRFLLYVLPSISTSYDLGATWRALVPFRHCLSCE